MKKGILIAGLVAAIVFLIFYPRSSSDEIKIGIVLPMQHEALDDIVNGFKSEISTALGNRPFAIEIQNALGDINLQKSAINKFINDKVDLLVPVAKTTALMSLNLAPKNMPILFLAADIPSDSDTAKQKPGLMGIIDEISVELQLKLIQLALPHIEKITVIYSSTDKVFDDVEFFRKIALTQGISTQKLMVQNLSELYTVSARIDANSQAIFILKDNLIASGIATLVQQANRLKIPLITSDEGTIKQGGAFAVGVIEADIGRQGGQMAAAFFMKTHLEQPIQQIKNISVFMNKAACELQGIETRQVLQAAATLNLAVIDG